MEYESGMLRLCDGDIKKSAVDSIFLLFPTSTSTEERQLGR